MAPSRRQADKPVDEPLEPAADAQPDESDEALAEPEPEPADELPFMSAGVASDLEQRGWAGDPATGGTFRKDPETGVVTFTPRGGDDKIVVARDVPGLV